MSSPRTNSSQVEVRQQLVATENRGKAVEPCPSNMEEKMLKNVVTFPKAPKSRADRRPLKEKYAPTSFADIVGNDDAVECLTSMAEDRFARAFLVSGPTGTGKSTLAKLYCRSFTCTGERPYGVDPCGVCRECKEPTREMHFTDVFSHGIQIIPAGAFRDGSQAVEAVLSAIDMLRKPIIVDEADCLHGSQRRLLDRLGGDLKYPVFLTTTVTPGKMDPQLVGRCTLIETQLVSDQAQRAFLCQVARAEGVNLDDTDLDEIMATLRKRKVAGQVRDALAHLEQVLTVRKRASRR